MPLYLTDSSIWIGAKRRRGTYLPSLLGERLEDDQIATCIPVALEVLVGTPGWKDLESEWEEIWSRLRWLSVDEPVPTRALELLRALARTTEGAHRRRPIDYLLAACAEAGGEDVVLWHWDRDLTAICDFAGIRHEAEHDRATEHRIGLEPGETAG